MLDYIVKQKDNDRSWIHTLSSVMEELVKLGLATCRKEKNTQEGKACLRCTPSAPEAGQGRILSLMNWKNISRKENANET